jgi:hypothetical protein
LLSVALRACLAGRGFGNSSAGRSWVTAKTMRGGTMDASPSPTPSRAKSAWASAMYQPRTVARMMASRVPAMEKTMR